MYEVEELEVRKEFVKRGDGAVFDAKIHRRQPLQANAPIKTPPQHYQLPDYARPSLLNELILQTSWISRG